MGKRIKQECKRQKLTLETFAEIVGISRNFLWKIEVGKKAPALQTLYTLSRKLDISVDYLMGLSEFPKGEAYILANWEIMEEILWILNENTEKENRMILKLLNTYKEAKK